LNRRTDSIQLSGFRVKNNSKPEENWNHREIIVDEELTRSYVVR